MELKDIPFADLEINRLQMEVIKLQKQLLMLGQSFVGGPAISFKPRR